MKLRISPTTVEEFRKVVDTDLPFATEEKLVDSVARRGTVGWQAHWGTALHAFIEAPDTYRSTDGTCYRYPRDTADPIVYPAEVVDPCVTSWPRPCVFERPMERTALLVVGHEVLVSGRADALHGLVIVEGKTRFGPVYVDSYADSFQPMAYLWCLPWASCVEFRVHEIRGVKDEGGVPSVSSSGLTLAAIHVFRVWRQADLEDRVTDLLGRFVEWAESRDLLDYLRADRPRSRR